MIHIGSEIRKKAKELHVGSTVLSELVSTSKQNIHLIFKKDSLDTNQLLQFSRALKFNFFDLYKAELKDVIPAIDNTITNYREEREKARQAALDLKKIALTLMDQDVIAVKRLEGYLAGRLVVCDEEAYHRPGAYPEEQLYIDILPLSQFSPERFKEMEECRPSERQWTLFRLKYCRRLLLKDVQSLQFWTEAGR